MPIRSCELLYNTYKYLYINDYTTIFYSRVISEYPSICDLTIDEKYVILVSALLSVYLADRGYKYLSEFSFLCTLHTIREDNDCISYNSEIRYHLGSLMNCLGFSSLFLYTHLIEEYNITEYYKTYISVVASSLHDNHSEFFFESCVFYDAVSDLMFDLLYATEVNDFVYRYNKIVDRLSNLISMERDTCVFISQYAHNFIDNAYDILYEFRQFRFDELNEKALLDSFLQAGKCLKDILI